MSPVAHQNNRTPLLRASMLIVTAACLSAAVMLLQHFAVQTEVGQRIDETLMTLPWLSDAKLQQISIAALGTVNPAVLASLAGAALVMSALRRDLPLILQNLATVAAANLATQLIKHELIQRPVLTSDLMATSNSFPSGHVTLAATAALTVILASPSNARAGVGTVAIAWVAAVSLGTVAARWHRPSDIIGAVLVVLLFATLACGIRLLVTNALNRQSPASSKAGRDGLSR